jgi:hypothetical protein
VILLNGYPTPEGKTDDEHFTFVRLTHPTWWYIALEALDALLAALPDMGLKVVPVAANEAMVKSAKKAMLRAGFDLEDFADVTWSAMLAAAPDLLGGEV